MMTRKKNAVNSKNNVASNRKTVSKSNSNSSKKKSSSSSSKKQNTCTITVNCSSVPSRLNRLPRSKQQYIPRNGYMLSSSVSLSKGDSAYTILTKAARSRGLNVYSSYSSYYKTANIYGIGGLNNYDCGSRCGWILYVNGRSVGNSAGYTVQKGDRVEFRYVFF